MRGIIAMKRITSIVLGLTLTLILAAASRTWAGNIVGVVQPQGLRSAENILVYLTKAPDVSVDISQTKYLMDQQQLAFIPHILPVLVGAKVEFPNSDKVAHNVFSLSQAKRFNLGSYKTGESRTVVFDQPGVVDLRCDVHQEMNAYILVLKSPYFAITDEKGNFTIPDQRYLESKGIKGVPPLSPGTYLVKTWHEKLNTAKQKVEVPANGDVSIELKPKRGAPGVLYK
jgi:plastocyanin